jgi:hypothetical protein
MRGLRSGYQPNFLFNEAGGFDREGILVAIVLFLAPFLLLYLFGRLLPLEPVADEHAGDLAHGGSEEPRAAAGASPGAAA